MAQARQIQALLAKAEGIAPQEADHYFPILTYITTGDRQMAPSLAALGGKGLFTKEVEDALLAGEADLAVHSMKDMPAQMPTGLSLAAVPVREDPRDAFVTPDGRRLEDMPPGARIGTSAVRRAAQIRQLRPDLEIVPLRGNVGTRLEKLKQGEADGTFLAEAGLQRLQHTDIPRQLMDPASFLPALGQGSLCLQARSEDATTLTRCLPLQCPRNMLVSAAERAFLAELDGSCQTPMAGYGQMQADDSLQLTAQLLSPDGGERVQGRRSAQVTSAQVTTIDAARTLGQQLASDLKAKAEPDFLARWVR